MISYGLLRALHLLGMLALAAGLIGAFVIELRMRRSADLDAIGKGLRCEEFLFAGLVFPGALVTGASGILLVFVLGLGFFDLPWLTGMWLLFAFEFVEGNTVTRGHGLAVRREFAGARVQGVLTPGFRRSLRSWSGTFGLCLDLPLGLVMVSLGVMRPMSWSHFGLAVPAAVVIASVLTSLVLRLEPAASRCALRSS